MVNQSWTERVAKSAHDEAKLLGFVEDIRVALIDYQVRIIVLKVV